MFRVLFCLALLTVPALSQAQDGQQSVSQPDQQPTVQPPTQPPTPQPTPKSPPAVTRPTRTPAEEVRESAAALRTRVNVQIELTIADQSGSGSPAKKTVSMLVADSTMGRIRASARARQMEPSKDTGFVGTGLNVDARPQLLENDRIMLELTIEYSPLLTGTGLDKVMQSPTELNESIRVILTNGKPVVISQAADPLTDRKITVEVKATIVK
jgi:hypothetical protein